MALFITLMMAALLLMLSGAFIQINMASFQFAQNSDRDQRATQAALTGLEYARMRLESSHAWGLTGSGSNVSLIANPGFQIWESDNFTHSGHSEFISVGVLDSGRSHFQIIFVNPGQTVSDAANGQFSDSAIEKNPANWGAWATTTLRGGDTSINYMNDPNQFDPPLTGSQCPGRAVPRTRARVLVIGYCQGSVKRADTTLGLTVFASAGLASGNNMVVESNSWTLDSTVSDNNQASAGNTAYVPGNSGALVNMNFVASGGNFASKKQIYADSYGSVASDGIDSNGNIDVTFGITPHLTNSSTVAPGGKLSSNSAVAAIPVLDAPTVESWLPNFSNSGVLPAGTYQFQDDHTVTYGGTTFSNSIPLGGAQVVLKNHEFIIPDDSHVSVQGNLRLTTADGQAPTLAIGYKNDGSLDNNAKGSYLNVQNGNLTIAGSMVGKGSVVVNGTTAPADDDSVNVQGTSQMSAAPNLGITVFSQGSVTVSSPPSGDFHSGDWNVLNPGILSYAPLSSSKWADPSAPMAQWNKLAAADKDTFMGGAAVTNDSQPDSTYLRSTPLPLSQPTGVNNAINALGSNFSCYGNTTVQSQVQALLDVVTNGQTTALTPGGYARINEFLLESQTAFTNGQPLPCASDLTASNASAWADLTANNAQINSYLENELSWFESQGQYTNGSSWNLKSVANATSNPLGSSNPRDANWIGLLYSQESVLVNCAGGTFQLTGSVMAAKDMAVLNATNVRTKFDPSYGTALSMVKVGSSSVQKINYVYFSVY